VRLSARKIVNVCPPDHSPLSIGLGYVEEQQPRFRRLCEYDKVAVYRSMPNAIQEKIVARLEAARVQYVATKSRGVRINASLSKVLQRFAIRWIVTSLSKLQS